MKSFKELLSESKRGLSNYDRALQECNNFYLRLPEEVRDIDGWRLDEIEWKQNATLMYANSRVMKRDDLLGIAIYATPMLLGEDSISAFVFFEGNDEIEFPETRIDKVSNLIMEAGSDPQKNIARIVKLTLRAGIEEMRKMFSTMSLKDMLNFFPLDKDDPQRVVESIYENIYNGDPSMFPGGRERIDDLLGKAGRINKVRNIFNK